MNYNISPYAYCADNPVNAVDPDGNKIKLIGGTNILPILQGTVPEVYRSYITLDENGDAVKSAVINKVVNGKFVYLTTVEPTK